MTLNQRLCLLAVLCGLTCSGCAAIGRHRAGRARPEPKVLTEDEKQAELERDLSLFSD